MRFAIMTRAGLAAGMKVLLIEAEMPGELR
jgi:hypothetical protein